jgi:DNA-binding MarR family transcriptional regulator
VERRPDPSDRRATFVELTDSGIEICSDMQKAFDSFAAQLFAGISPGDVEAAVKTIAVIRKNFEQMLAP